MAAPQFICVFVFIFRIFPREYLLQQIHLYSLADLQQVSIQRGHFFSCFFPEEVFADHGLGMNSAIIGVVCFTKPDNQLIFIQNGEKKKTSMKRYSKTVKNAGKDVEKLELSHVAGGSVK